jgi:hypothetical protein
MSTSEKLDTYRLHEFLDVHTFAAIPGIGLSMCACGMLSRGYNALPIKSSVHVTKKCVAAMKKMYGRDVYHCSCKLYHLRRYWK